MRVILGQLLLGEGTGDIRPVVRLVQNLDLIQMPMGTYIS